MPAKLKFTTGPDWCQKKAKLLKDFVLSRSIAPFAQVKANTCFWNHYFELLRKGIKRKKEALTRHCLVKAEEKGPWKQLWRSKALDIKDRSPYSHFESLKIRPMIMKAGDDLRQELLALKLIRHIAKIFKQESVRLYLRPYDIIIRDHQSGFIGSHQLSRVHSGHHLGRLAEEEVPEPLSA